jgi:hypothetical protein
MSTEPTIGKLVVDAVEDIRTLVHAEVQLAKTELKTSLMAGGIGALLFAVAAFLGLLIVILLSIAFAFLLTMTGLHPAWCFLIVAGVYAILAVVAVMIGVLKVKKIRAPQQTIATASRIPSALKGKY